jgi:L-malate glycosyltransferase
LKRALHQLVPNLAFGDAISQQALTLRALLRSAGFSSEIYAQHVDGRLRGEALPFARLLDAGDAAVLFHFSIGSAVTDVFRRFRGPRALAYHNVTPAEFFHGVNERVARDCRAGREELGRLHSVATTAVADSEFNAAELRALGYGEVAVLPIVLDPARYDVRPVRRLERPYRDGHANFLHVGRLVPNKRLEDTIKIFHFFRRHHDAEARLFLVGIDVDTEVYSFALRDLARELGVGGVVFTGGVSQRELVTYYRLADVYLCMSEHEGFCVPLVEAMHFGVPIVAYAATAVPETLDGAGLCVSEKRHAAIAELLALLREDGDVRARLVAAGRERARAFLPDAVRPAVLELARRLLA